MPKLNAARILNGTLEAGYMLTEIAAMLTRDLLCSALRHPEPLELQPMSHGAVSVCKRCRRTIEPNR